MHLFIGTPCYGGLVTHRYMQSVCALLDFGARHGLSVSVELVGFDSLITRSRNGVVAKFLDDPNATHLMFIDADIGFTPDQVIRMLGFGQEVVAGMYPLKIVNYGPDVIERVEDGEPLETAQLRYVGVLEPPELRQEINGFATGEFAGAGFLLIRRSALLRMIAAFPQLRYQAVHTGAPPNASLHQYALFDCLIEPGTGHYLSEDYAFCHRWRSIGGKLWLDQRSALMHIGPREFVGNAALRHAAPVAHGAQA